MKDSIRPRATHSQAPSPITSTTLSIAEVFAPGLSWLAKSADRIVRFIVLGVLAVAVFFVLVGRARAEATDAARNHEADNARLLQRFYAAFMAADAEATTALVTPDFVMHVPGKGLNAGEYWGRDGLRQFMANIKQYNGGVFSMKVDALATGAGTAFTHEIVVINR
jgi:hypothetical protein